MASPRLVIFFLYDSTTGAPYTGLTGLTFDVYETDLGVNISPHPTIAAIGGGAYGFLPTFAADPNRLLVFVVNPNSALVTPNRVAGYIRPEEYNLDTAGQPYVTFTASGDTIRPVIYSVQAPQRNKVKVIYSEAVLMTTDADGALNLANYSIPGLTILNAASIAVDQVMLTTSLQTPGQTYSLTISNVEDLNGNPIA